MEFARFPGLPLRTRANVTDIAGAVCQVLIDARADLVLIEIHNLNHGTPPGKDLPDRLKAFSDQTPINDLGAAAAGHRSSARGCKGRAAVRSSRRAGSCS